MKTYLLLLFSVFYSFSLFSQTYRKDIRSVDQKEDPLEMYKVNSISKYDLLNALEINGVRIHKFNFGSFDKEYTITMLLEEYLNGKQVKSEEILNIDNTYFYSTDSVYTDSSVVYFDYIDQISLYSKENENGNVNLNISTFNIGSKTKLKRNFDREHQFYSWRYYTGTEWKGNINEPIPLLIYASSWDDQDMNFERFCGIAKLSAKQDDKDSIELLESSPHYFMISYKVSEKRE